VKRFYYVQTLRGWSIHDRKGQSGGHICDVDDNDIADCICDALNARFSE
jgi:hypothetical protein